MESPDLMSRRSRTLTTVFSEYRRRKISTNENFFTLEETGPPMYGKVSWLLTTPLCLPSGERSPTPVETVLNTRCPGVP